MEQRRARTNKGKRTIEMTEEEKKNEENMYAKLFNMDNSNGSSANEDFDIGIHSLLPIYDKMLSTKYTLHRIFLPEISFDSCILS